MVLFLVRMEDALGQVLHGSATTTTAIRSHE